MARGAGKTGRLAREKLTSLSGLVGFTGIVDLKVFQPVLRSWLAERHGTTFQICRRANWETADLTSTISI